MFWKKLFKSKKANSVNEFVKNSVDINDNHLEALITFLENHRDILTVSFFDSQDERIEIGQDSFTLSKNHLLIYGLTEAGFLQELKLKLKFENNHKNLMQRFLNLYAKVCEKQHALNLKIFEEKIKHLEKNLRNISIGIGIEPNSKIELILDGVVYRVEQPRYEAPFLKILSLKDENKLRNPIDCNNFKKNHLSPSSWHYELNIRTLLDEYMYMDTTEIRLKDESLAYSFKKRFENVFDAVCKLRNEEDKDENTIITYLRKNINDIIAGFDGDEVNELKLNGVVYRLMTKFDDTNFNCSRRSDRDFYLEEVILKDEKKQSTIYPFINNDDGKEFKKQFLDLQDEVKTIHHKRKASLVVNHLLKKYGWGIG